MSIPRIPLLLVLLVGSGCADARGRFEDFQARLEHIADAGKDAASDDYDGGPCTPPDPGVVGGPALLALDTNLTPGEATLFLGTIDTPALDGTTAVHFVYHAVDAMDRHTLLGDELEVGPYPLHDGVLTAAIARSSVDGRANPAIYGTPLDTSMTLHGHICGVKTFYCGTLDGEVYGLLSGEFTGHFGITLLSGPDAIPAQPRFGCDATQLAPALPASP